MGQNANTIMDLLKDKYGNYVIQRVLDVATEPQRLQMIEKIKKLALGMKKHKSHARHVFNFLEKTYGITLQFGDEESKTKAKKGERKSMGTKKTTQLIEENPEKKKAKK